MTRAAAQAVTLSAWRTIRTPTATALMFPANLINDNFCRVALEATQLFPYAHKNLPQVVVTDAITDAPNFVSTGISLNQLGISCVQKTLQQIWILKKLGFADLIPSKSRGCQA